MKTKRKTILFLVVSLLSLLMSLLLFIYISLCYSHEKVNYSQVVAEAFNEAIIKEVNAREKVLTDLLILGSTPLGVMDSTDIVIKEGKKVVLNEKKGDNLGERYLNFLQSILYIKNHPMKVEDIDSLFHKELCAKNIYVRSSIVLVDNQKDITYQGKNEITHLTPILSEPMYIGAQKEMSIQAYVDTSVLVILKRLPKYYWPIAISWVLLLLGLGIFIPYYYKRTKKLVVKQYADQLIEFAAIPNTETSVDDEYKGDIQREEQVVQVPDNRGIYLTENLFFDIKLDVLYYRGIPVEMTPQTAKTLHVFIEAPDHFLSMEEIRLKMWGKREITDGAVRRCISRLKKVIEDIPELSLTNLPGEGYRLDILV